MIPYCICLFDGKLIHSFYLSDYNSSEDMVKAFINLLFTRYTATAHRVVKRKVGVVEGINYKYNGYLVYVHNFSRFDSIFMLKVLIKYASEKGYTIDIFVFKNKEIVIL